MSWQNKELCYYWRYEGDRVSDKLIIYFSITGKTKHAALRLKEILQADILEIKPQTPYTSDDLDRYNKESRTILENNNSKILGSLIE